MEQLKIIPLLMFFTGMLFVYAGFTDQSPSTIIRNTLNPANNGGLPTYGPGVNPIYSGVTNAGVLAYQAPSNNLNVGTF
jgi:hypothetical protein